MVRAVEIVRERMASAVLILEAAKIDYAVIGDHAASAWIASVDKSAVRNAVEAEFLIRPQDLDMAASACINAGLLRCDESLHGQPGRMFVERPGGKKRNAVQFYCSGDAIGDGVVPDPMLSVVLPSAAFRVLNLEPLVRLFLASNRTLGKVHVRDMIDVGLVDESWRERLDDVLRPRLQHLLDTPDG